MHILDADASSLDTPQSETDEERKSHGQVQYPLLLVVTNIILRVCLGYRDGADSKSALIILSFYR